VDFRTGPLAETSVRAPGSRCVRTRHALAAISLAALIAAAIAPGDEPAGAKPKQQEPAPNVVVVMTDDQTVESLRAMPRTERLLAERGVEFANNFVTNPICCPSRATFLTGRYPHNHGVLRNGAPNGGYARLDGTETLPVWLQRAGYHTAHIGKYLNGYGRTAPLEVPPGWSEWKGSVDPTTYSMYGYTLNENGTLTTYGNPDVEDPATYQTDVYAQKAVELIGRRAPRRKPFFLSVAPLAPHSEADLGDEEPSGTTPGPRAAPRHEGAFAAEPLPQPPSYNEADVSDKPAEIQARNPIGASAAATIEARYRDRLESLLAVDEMVAAIVDALRESGELDETLIVFTADNGFFHGEHRVRTGKQQVYEESIRVPLVIRGPGLPEGAVRSQPVANVDLAATILEYAGLRSPVPPDGRSLRRLANDPRLEPGRAILIENWCGPREPCFDPLLPRYQAVRTHGYLYAERPTGEAELYDLAVDPYQLDSRHADPAYAEIRAALARLLAQMKACVGEGCRVEPKLKLALGFDRDRADGKPCADSRVRLSLRGANAGEATTGDVFVDGKPRGDDVDARGPAKVRQADLNRRRESELRYNVTVLDGRVLSLDVTLPRRC
jgi:N-acetylglucosamine-6-sulfatase